MTREETIKVIGIITTAYPNFDKFRDEKHIRSMVAIWADMFSEDDAGLVDIYRALPRTIAEAVDSIGYGQLYAMHVAYARGHAAKAGLDRVAFMQAYEDKVERQRRKAMLPGSLRQKIEAVSAGLDDGTRSLIEGVNRRYEERQALYRRLAEPRDLLALVGGEDAEAKLLEERERRALEARYERDDYE